MSVNRWAAVARLALLALASPACGGSGGGGGHPVGFVVTTSSPSGGHPGDGVQRHAGGVGETLPYAWKPLRGRFAGGPRAQSGLGRHQRDPGRTRPEHVHRAGDRQRRGPGLSAARALSISVTTSGAQYDPPWSGIAPTTIITFTYNGGQTSTQNGSALKAAMNGPDRGTKAGDLRGHLLHQQLLRPHLQRHCERAHHDRSGSRCDGRLRPDERGENVMNVGSAPRTVPRDPRHRMDGRQ